MQLYPGKRRPSAIKNDQFVRIAHHNAMMFMFDRPAGDGAHSGRVHSSRDEVAKNQLAIAAPFESINHAALLMGELTVFVWLIWNDRSRAGWFSI